MDSKSSNPFHPDRLLRVVRVSKPAATLTLHVRKWWLRFKMSCDKWRNDDPRVC